MHDLQTHKNNKKKAFATSGFLLLHALVCNNKTYIWQALQKRQGRSSSAVLSQWQRAPYAVNRHHAAGHAANHNDTKQLLDYGMDRDRLHHMERCAAISVSHSALTVVSELLMQKAYLICQCCWCSCNSSSLLTGLLCDCHIQLFRSILERCRLHWILFVHNEDNFAWRSSKPWCYLDSPVILLPDASMHEMQHCNAEAARGHTRTFETLKKVSLVCSSTKQEHR